MWVAEAYGMTFSDITFEALVRKIDAYGYKNNKRAVSIVADYIA